MITIASYNIRKSVGLDWKRNPLRIQQVLAELDADVILLQEADKRVGKRAGTLCEDSLLDELGYRFADVAIRELSHGWHGNAILYRQSLQLLDCQRIDIPIFKSRLEPRGAVTASFALANGKILRVVGAHLSLIKSMRKEQILYIIEQLQSLSPQANHQPHQAKHDYVVIGGDFNEAKAEQWFSNSALDDYRLITPGFTFHASKPLRAFDRFIISDNISDKVKNSSVQRTELSKKASDHLPITLQLELC